MGATRRTLDIVTLLAGLAAAGYWAVALVILQPGSEPAELADNNTYWVRDQRWMAILAVIAALIVTARGNRRFAVWSAAGLVCLLGLDISLDRVQPTGWAAAAAVGAVAAVAVGLAWLAARPRAGRPDHRVSLLVVGVSAALAPLAAMATSPTDTEASLLPSALVVSGALIAVTVAGALAASPVVRGWWAPAGVAAAAACCLATARLLSPGAGAALLDVLLAVVLFTGSALLAWRRQVPTAYALVALLSALIYPALVFAAVVLFVAVPWVAPLTALAGSPPVQSADTDSLATSAGIVPGLLMGLLLIGGARTRECERELPLIVAGE